VVWDRSNLPGSIFDVGSVLPKYWDEPTTAKISVPSAGDVAVGQPLVRHESQPCYSGKILGILRIRFLTKSPDCCRVIRGLVTCL